MKDLIIDPEFRDLLPPLTEDERSGLESNLLANGCEDAIQTWDGIVIDGMNRYELCKKHKLWFDVKEKTLIEGKEPTRESVKRWMIRRQIDKRNLSDYIRIELAEKLVGEQAKTEAKERQKRKPNSVSAESALGSKSAKTVAEEAGVSTRKVEQARKIKRDATPEVKEAVESGEMSINAAYETTKPTSTTKKFNDKEYDALVGKLVRGLTERAKLYGKGGFAYGNCEACLENFVEAWQAWRAEG